MKKVLIITYYWPPCGGIGVLRCLKFAKYLREFGWEPIIFTAEGADYPSYDETNLGDIPDGISVLRQKIWEPYKFYRILAGLKKDANVNNVFYVKSKKAGWGHKLSVWIRSNFFIPDARCFWIKPSVTYLKEYLKENNVDAILSNGPPHSNTRIATLLKKETGIPWLADFQDPWSQVDYFGLLKLMGWARKKHLKMEQEVFENADKITTVSEGFAEDLTNLGAKDIDVLYWGYDPDDYTPYASVKPDSLFTITHAGILGYDRFPIGLLHVISRLKEEIPGFSDDLRIQLLGQVDHVLIQHFQDLGLEENINLLGSRSRSESIKIMSTSNILLLLLNQQPNAKGRIPGKLFEYLALRRPILCQGPEGSDVSRILTNSNAGWSLDYDDEEGLYNRMKTLYNEYKLKQLKDVVNSDIEDYDVREITRRLSAILDEISG